MIRYVRDIEVSSYLLLTECSMGDNIAVEHPDKEMVRICSIRCPHMNEITMEDTLSSLRNMQHVIEIPEDIRIRAYRAVKRMIDIGPGGGKD